MRRFWLLLPALFAVQAGVLYMLGQPLLCTCGSVKLWEGVVLSLGTSQQLTDWYTFSHVIHGLIFYAFLRYAFPSLTMRHRLLIALGLEVAWEIIENTPYVISLYRQQALAVGYSGDSILNSLSDSLFMLLGFGVAWRAPVWLSISLVALLEVWVGLSVRDNLFLNILNFVAPLSIVEAWQQGG